MDRCDRIKKFALRDHFTKDTEYNAGLKLIRMYGYLQVCEVKEVKYYCLCNNI